MNDSSGMNRHSAPQRAAAVLGTAASLLLAGCGADPGEEGLVGYGTWEEALYVSSTTIWKSLSIPVCWENPSASTSTRRGWVKDQITNTWQVFSQVKFTGWGTCTSTAKGIRIKIVDETATTGALLGRNLDGVANGMKLNLGMTAPAGYKACATSFGAEACVRSTATHEFGHALGFAHEQMRFDNPDFDCLDLIGGDFGNTYVGTYDKSSIMRSCTVRDSAKATLSTSDKLGLQAFYGTPSPANFRKDSVVWNKDYVISFFGVNMSRYSILLDKAEDYFPSPIKGIAGSWPTTSPWTTGVDAVADYSSTKVYLFSGSQYLRMDKATFTVDAGYPKSFPGGWSNWPSTWTGVDAAIKWKNDKVYLFRGSEYLRLTGTSVDAGYPKPISGNWKIPYTSGFDHAFIYSDGKAYFFKGAEHIRVNISGATEVVDPGYPMPTVGRWPGMPF